MDNSLIKKTGNGSSFVRKTQENFVSMSLEFVKILWHLQTCFLACV